MPPPGNLNVLVVDDNATSRQILQDMLESFSFNVALAASGREGLVEIEKGLENKPFDLVLMDWKMPDMDGIEASRQIMIHPKLDKAPAIILVTAYGREELMQKSDQLGLDGFLIKPVSPSVLLDNIMHALGEKKTGQTRPAGLQDQEAEWNKHFRGAQVLLAEDNEINQQVAQEILQNAGFIVDLADDGKQAVEALKNKSYDAVLMDIQMPVLDGYEATKKIRKWESRRRQASNLQPPTSNIPIIAMTAHAMTGDREKSLEAGMNDHVTKPIDPEQLFATLQRWIRPAENRGRPSTDQDVMPPAAARETSVSISEPVTRAAEDDDFPSQIPGFDLSAGMQRLQGNVHLYKKLLRDFAANYATTPVEIKTALDSDDMNQAHHLVHSLKGVSANLAATDLQAAAIEMENLVKPGKQKQPPSAELLNSTLTELEGVLMITLESIESLGPAAAAPIMEPSEDSFPALPPELAREASERIREAADMGDISQLKSIAEKLSSKVNAFSPVAKKIIQLAEEFDFEGLVTLADSLLE
jgi:CheY-like chemotaxis protein/HPt (histidine-containing phosphotransfer) domain-containing protein